VLGATQSGGRSSLKLLRVARDGDVIADARELASEVLADDPGLAGHRALAAEVRRRLDAEATGS
jgi:ATP-dependent DNA helicase RecG